MSHEELRDRLLDLAYGELSPRDAREVEEHAASCERCRAELAAIRGTRRVMAALPVEPAPERGERILVAAAREAVRARPPRRAWPRWLWAAPVVASLAAVVVLSLRVGTVRPPTREDPDALRGEAPAVAQAQRPAAAPPPPASPAPRPEREAKRAPAEHAAPPPQVAMKEADAERREVASSRFATPPPEGAPSREDAPSFRPSPPLRGGEGDRASPSAGAAAASPMAALAPPPTSPREPVGATAVNPAPPSPREAMGGPAVNSTSPSPREAGGGPGRGAAEAEAKRDSAPARRAAKAMAAPEPRDGSPRDRAIAAALADARRSGFDPRGMELGVEGPTTLDAWRGAHVPTAAPALLEGRRFWAVGFTRPGATALPAFTVFVEDGTFRAVATVPGQ